MENDVRAERAARTSGCRQEEATWTRCMFKICPEAKHVIDVFVCVCACFLAHHLRCGHDPPPPYPVSSPGARLHRPPLYLPTGIESNVCMPRAEERVERRMSKPCTPSLPPLSPPPLLPLLAVCLRHQRPRSAEAPFPVHSRPAAGMARTELVVWRWEPQTAVMCTISSSPPELSPPSCSIATAPPPPHPPCCCW